ncbi:MAG: glycoside hydrolase family 32 protein [Candidatus Hydrogenedentes bacterium]|nr:glycoside hydrolase family 32 protein [Candidatus Hydrogenedentota bacterium]
MYCWRWFRSFLLCGLLPFVGHAMASAAEVDPPSAENPAIQRAMAAVAAAVPQAKADARRPQYHFAPPAQWMNDPNGPIFWNGYYHMFYQHNPYGDRWDHMHWGHARSRDLVRWEHLPIALWPSEEQGENHCFSGSATIAPNGQVMLFYTSIGNRAPEQWAAISKDQELLTWEKHPDNPLLAEIHHGGSKVYEWRDPYVFQHEGTRYMVCGGNLNESKGGQAAVQLYRAENDALTEWTHRGVLFIHPDADVKNIECPNFFPLQNKWVLIVSAHRNPEYFVGIFDPKQAVFTMETRGHVDYGDYYAPNGCFDPRQRHVLWGWVRGFDFAQGWNGCLSLPRVLSLNAAGAVLQQPAPELEALRMRELLKKTLTLTAEPIRLEEARSTQLELVLSLQPQPLHQLGLTFEAGAAGGAFTIGCFDDHLDVAGTAVPLDRTVSAGGLSLRIFCDRSVIEVYVNEGARCVTKVFPQGGGLLVPVLSHQANTGQASVEAWELRSIW